MSKFDGPKIVTSIPGPKASRIIERHRKAFVTSTMVEYPLVGEEGSGVFVKDVDGNVFLDFAAGIASLPTGHCHPRIVEVVKTQVERLMHFAGNDFYNQWQVELAEKLKEITPGRFDKRVFLSSSGTESCEAALKLARRHTRRPKLLSFIGAFHGRSMGSLSLTFSKPVHRKYYEPFMGGVLYTPYAYCYRCPFKLAFPDCDLWCVHFIEEVLFRHVSDPSEVAALFVEPVQGEGGFVVPPLGFLRMLRRLCDKYGILLVCDEVQAGLGRTGKMFSCEHEGVVPDIVCMAKALGAGLSMGATVARAEVADWEAGAHSNSFGGNPVICAASLAGIEVLVEEGLLENAARVGEYALKRLGEMKEEHEIVGDVRGRGLMIGVEFVKDKETRERFQGVSDVLVEAHRRGLILLPCGVNCIRVVPPLIITREQMDKGLDILEQSVSEVEKRL